jgi:CheY-like chemotaxis protein
MSSDLIRLKPKTTLKNKKKSLIKILYIEPGVDEKEGSRVLEKCTESLDEYCFSFTVVPNGFVGLECTEHTCFDLIIVQSSMPQIRALEFLHILRTVGAPTSVVLLVDLTITDEWCDIEESRAKELGFTAILRKPFSTNHLCTLLKNILDEAEAEMNEKRDSLSAFKLIANTASASSSSADKS